MTRPAFFPAPPVHIGLDLASDPDETATLEIVVTAELMARDILAARRGGDGEWVDLTRFGWDGAAIARHGAEAHALARDPGFAAQDVIERLALVERDGGEPAIEWRSFADADAFFAVLDREFSCRRARRRLPPSGDMATMLDHIDDAEGRSA